MAPRPPLYDPARGVDRLPQPYRMVDKLVAEIVERALAECALKDKQKRQERANLDRPRFGPHAILLAEGNSTCFTTPGIAGLAVVGTEAGEVFAHTARDNTAIGKDHPHTSAVTAMDSGHVAATSAKIVASASRGCLVIHEIVIKTAELILLAKIDLPSDPDGGEHYPCSVSFSANAGHVAVCYSSGALAVYELDLPASYYASASKPAETIPRPPVAGGAVAAGAPAVAGRVEGCLTLVVHMSVATVKGLLVGAMVVGESRIEWQLQQRPDKSGKSDRFHKPARGIYMWWQGCNRIALSYLDSAPSAIAPPAGSVAPPQDRAPSPQKGAKPLTPVPAAAPAGTEEDSAAKRVQRKPYRGWLFPHGVTCSCITYDGTMLAFGLVDGSVVVWDDQFGGHIRVLPRMPSAVTAMSYVHGMPQKLLCTSADGTIYVADFVRPEDSYTAGARLPHAAAEVHFLAGDPFAIFMCPGGGGKTTASGPGAGSPASPQVIWYDMNDHKLIAECIGKSKDFGFGTSCTYQLPATAVPLDPSAPPDESSVAPAPSPSLLPPLYPRWRFKESYFIAGGPLQRSPSFRPADGRDPDDVPEAEWPHDSSLLLYKIDALSRYLSPEENQSKASKSLLERMLAELNPPKKRIGKHVKYGIPDPDAPKPPPSAMRRSSGSGAESADDDDDARSTASGMRKHIAFEGSDAGLFDDENHKSSKKQFKKEMRSGGYSEGLKRPGADPKGDSAGSTLQRPGPSFTTERPQSPPWHHTNPLARIHPDWEEAPVLARIMDRIGTKGGGRKKRDRRLIQVASEMSTKLAKEPGPKPVLLAPKN